MGSKTTLFLLLLVFLSGLVQCVTAMVIWTAIVEISYESQNNETVSRYGEYGVYGRNSPVDKAYGIVTLPSFDPMGCAGAVYNRSDISLPWIALVKRGECNFSDKINAAKLQGAAAVVVYNVENSTTFMAHKEAKGIVAIMIGNNLGTEIVSLIQRGIEVTMGIEVGGPHGPWVDTYWLYLLSIAFFIVTAASIAYFVFISAHRIHNLRMNRRVERKLKSEAKKAINKLEVRTLKAGVNMAGLEEQTCAVCIDAYKAGDVVTVLTCGHIFHKACIEPWLLAKRTCPMCKCDILKALGVEEVDGESRPSTPPDVTVVTVAMLENMHDVPLTEPSPAAPERHQHHYDNRAFEGDSQATEGESHHSTKPELS